MESTPHKRKLSNSEIQEAHEGENGNAVNLKKRGRPRKVMACNDMVPTKPVQKQFTSTPGDINEDSENVPKRGQSKKEQYSRSEPPEIVLMRVKPQPPVKTYLQHKRGDFNEDTKLQNKTQSSPSQNCAATEKVLTPSKPPVQQQTQFVQVQQQICGVAEANILKIGRPKKKEHSLLRQNNTTTSKLLMPSKKVQQQTEKLYEIHADDSTIEVFDRTVDLSECTTESSLYAICRAWMANKPHKRSVHESVSPQHTFELNDELQDTLAMPPPEKVPASRQKRNI